MSTNSKSNMLPVDSKPGVDRRILLVAFLSIVGTLISYFSLYHLVLLYAGLQTGPSICNISAHINCDATNGSRYAFFLGKPLASWGVLFYTSLLGFSCFALWLRVVSRTVFFNVLLFFAVASSLFSIYLFLVSEFVVGALCIFCLGLYLVNFALLYVAWSAELTSRRLIARSIAGARLLLVWPLLALGFAPMSLPGSRLPARLGLLIIGILSGLILHRPALLVGPVLPDVNKIMEQKASVEFQAWQTQSIEKHLPVDDSSGALADYSRGPKNAPIQIVEFSDIECPMCRRTYSVIEDLLAKYTDKIRFTYKNYPLDRSCNPTMTHDLHKYACFAAIFARCAGEQGKFWEALRYVFELKELDEEGEAGAVRLAILNGADVLGLDAAGINQCMSSPRQLEKIRSDIREGVVLKISGTPSVWLNGRKMPNALPALFEVIIKSILG